VSAGGDRLSAGNGRAAAQGGEAGGRWRRCSRRLDAVLALAVALVALLVYWRTLAPGVLGGDSGELQFAAYLGGIAHPTGYPLFLVIGWLWTHLIPIGSVAWRMNLLSAAGGGAAVGLAYAMIEQLLRSADLALPSGARRLAAALAALAFGFSGLFWSQAVITEIYTVHAAFVAGLLWLLLRWASAVEHPRAAVSGAGLAGVALLYGFSLTHHRTMLLLAPAALLFIWRVCRARAAHRSERCGPRWLCCILLVLAPLLLYAYIPLRAPATPYVTAPLGDGSVLQLYDRSLRGFLNFVLGRVFAGSLLSPGEAWARLPGAASLLLRQLGWAGAALGLLGIVRLLLARRWRPLILTGLSFLTLVGFNLFYGIGDIAVFYIAPALILSAWAGLGVGVVAETVRRLAAAGQRLASRPVGAALTWMAVAAFVALPACLWASNRPLVDRRSDTAETDRWRAVLESAPAAEAILVSNDRDEIMPLWYTQWVDGQRRDVTGLFPLIVTAPGWGNVGQVVERGLETGRPVYLIKPMPGLDVKFAIESDGELQRVVGPAASDAPGQAVSSDLAATVRLLGYDLHAATPEGESGQLTVALHWQALAAFDGDFTSFVHLIDAGGERVGQSDHLVGGVYYPTSLWQPGEVLLDVHVLPVARSLGTEPYSLRAGFYRQPSLELLAEPVSIALPQNP